MFRILLLLSLPPILVALAARWWFGLRVLAEGCGKKTRADLTEWTPPADGKIIPAEDTAAAHGARLHTQAMAEWKGEHPSAFTSRESSLRFGLAVPPFAAIIAIFAAIVGKLHVLPAIGVFLLAIALAAIVTLMTLPAELHAITRTADRVRKSGAFPSSVDFSNVCRCAIAHAWLRSVPRILRLIQR